jgi:hypothetical protein
VLKKRTLYVKETVLRELKGLSLDWSVGATPGEEPMLALKFLRGCIDFILNLPFFKQLLQKALQQILLTSHFCRVL